MKNDRSFTAAPATSPFLAGLPTLEETAVKEAQELQRDAIDGVRRVFARIRFNVPAEIASAAGKVGHHELNQVVTERLTLWKDQEDVLIDRIQSHEFVSEAAGWIMRRVIQADPTAPLPMQIAWPYVLSETAKGVFSDADDDALFQRLLLEDIVTDAKGKNKDGQWSKPDSPKQWARVFGVSATTIKRRFNEGTIRNKMLSKKSYCVHVDDLPTQK